VNASSAPYNVAIGCLRAFVTLLVVAHHAVLADHPLCGFAWNFILSFPTIVGLSDDRQALKRKGNGVA
jgi:hypothetical protein